jgi:O-acetyl-ADP-ribose deacetylase (regulator of RNase III)
MTVQIFRGDIFHDQAEALVIPVNTVGVAGAGLAKQAAERYPEWKKDYIAACKHHLRSEGDVWVWYRFLFGAEDPPRLIVALATKTHWRSPSSLEGLQRGLVALSNLPWLPDTPALAMPALGCGRGGLDWKVVHPMIEGAFGASRLNVRLYEPQEGG